MNFNYIEYLNNLSVGVNLIFILFLFLILINYKSWFVPTANNQFVSSIDWQILHDLFAKTFILLSFYSTGHFIIYLSF